MLWFISQEASDAAFSEEVIDSLVVKRRYHPKLTGKLLSIE